jgi:hypothetical protein
MRGIWLDEPPLGVRRRVQRFFQPRDFHVKPADPLVELGLDDLAGVAIATSAVLEEGLDPIEELLLPLTDLDGMDLIRLGEFGDGLGLLGGLQGDLGLEGGGVPLAFITSRVVQFLGSTLDGIAEKWLWPRWN